MPHPNFDRFEYFGKPLALPLRKAFANEDHCGSLGRHASFHKQYNNSTDFSRKGLRWLGTSFWGWGVATADNPYESPVLHQQRLYATVVTELALHDAVRRFVNREQPGNESASKKSAGAVHAWSVTAPRGYCLCFLGHNQKPGLQKQWPCHETTYVRQTKMVFSPSICDLQTQDTL